MKDQFVLLLNNSYLNSGIPRNSGQFTADQTFHYKESALYLVNSRTVASKISEEKSTVYSLYSGKFGQP